MHNFINLTSRPALKSTQRTCAFAIPLLTLLLTACTPSAEEEAGVVEAMATEAPAQQMVPETLTAAFTAAAAGDHRSADNIARNAYRHPVETLNFFGIKPGMTVLEISPGGLWYTEVLAPALKGKGQFIVAGYDANIEGQPDYRYKQQQSMEQLFVEQPDLYSEVKVVKFSPPDSVQLGDSNSVDVVVTFRNFHGWIRDGIAKSNLQAFFEVLKPGGILGVVQHRTDVMAPLASGKISGYVSEQALIELAATAGFMLDEKSEINANSNDNQQHLEGVWTLPPSLRLKDQDKDKYLAIGESDRMTLKFKKPE
ncbi:MAG: putative methyltransferase [Pseudohongiellaceae bacterium]|jgi:predicted methyltransferase